MTSFLVSTVRRHTPLTEPSGYLYAIDLDSHQVLQRSDIIEPAYRGLDPNPRGGMRGSKGISVRHDQIAIANSMIVFRYDPMWNLLGFTTHPSCAGIHDILLHDDALWVTSARTDILFQFDLDGKLIKHYDVREIASSLKSLNWNPPLTMKARKIQEGSIDFRDPRTHREEETDNAHVNSLVLLPDGSCLISLGFIIGKDYAKLMSVKKSMIRLGIWPLILDVNRRALRFIEKRENHLDNALVVKPAKAQSVVVRISPNGEQSLCLVLTNMDAPSHSLQVLSDNSVIYLNTTSGTVIHFEPNSGEILSSTKVTNGFLRGVTILSNRFLLLGSNGQLITLDITSQRVVDQFTISYDPNESVYDVKELPLNYALPPQSLAEHFTQTTGYKDAESLINTTKSHDPS